MQKVVILGGGVAGITAALELSKKYKNNSNVEITLISREPYFLFAPNLYEVATSPEELTDLESLSHTITLPLEKIFKNTEVKLIKAEVTDVDHKQKIVEAGGKITALTRADLIVKAGRDDNGQWLWQLNEDRVDRQRLLDFLEKLDIK
jgi:NADH dehydrogenase FAD-containing subunit